MKTCLPVGSGSATNLGRVWPRPLTASFEDALQRRHPHHEKLVQVRAEDREELHPLEQGHARILRLLEHAPIELEPRQLAVDERVRVHSRSPAKGLAHENGVPYPPRAHHERQITAEDHDLLDDDRSGQDDVDALSFEAADPPALSLGETFESLADGRDVGLMEPQAVAARAVAMGPEVDAGQRADGATEAHHDLATRGRRQVDHELRADLVTERSH